MSWSLHQELLAVRDHARQTSSRIARTLLKSAEACLVVVGMPKGAVWLQHSATGRVLIHVGRGSVELRTTQATARLGAGMLVALEPRERHDVTALEDAAFLLVIAG
jgi:quercetin dioxygenase-like cupin family protein